MRSLARAGLVVTALSAWPGAARAAAANPPAVTWRRRSAEPTIDDDANVVVDDQGEAACVAGECRSAATP